MNEARSAKPNRVHPNSEIDELFAQLRTALCSWERATGRESLLIFREADRNLAEFGPQPSAVKLRLDNGVSVDPANADLDDAFLLQRFTDAITRSTASESPTPAKQTAEQIRDRLLEWLDAHNAQCTRQPCDEFINMLAYLAHSVGMQTHATHLNRFEALLAKYNRACPNCTRYN